MDDSIKINLFDIITNCNNKFQTEIILSLLKSKTNPNEDKLFKMINIILSIKEEYKLACLSRITSIDSSLKADKLLEIFKIVKDCNDKESTDAILNLLKNKAVINNEHVIELIQIIIKDMPSDIRYITLDAVKKLAYFKSEKITEFTDIISNSINHNAACMANIIVTNEEISSFPKINKVANIISQCQDKDKSRYLFNLINDIKNISQKYGVDGAVNIIEQAYKNYIPNNKTNKPNILIKKLP